jgi:adenine deaminase
VFNGVRAEMLPVKDGVVSVAEDPNLAYVAVFNRYGADAKTIAVIRNFGLTAGAVASTVSHDSHNLILVYRNPEDAWLLAQDLTRCGGGIGAYRDGKRIAVLELAVAGLMSLLPVAQLGPEIEAVDNALKEVCGGKSTYHKLLTLSLVVLPGILISDRGLVDGLAQKFVPVFPE